MAGLSPDVRTSAALKVHTGPGDKVAFPQMLWGEASVLVAKVVGLNLYFLHPNFPKEAFKNTRQKLSWGAPNEFKLLKGQRKSKGFV